nr:hypothetical protein [Klebsiella aerogenes]
MKKRFSDPTFYTCRNVVPAGIRVCLCRPAATWFSIQRLMRIYQGASLNWHWFSDIDHARKSINDRQQDYNECGPYSLLDYQTVAEFAVDWRMPVMLALCLHRK